MPEGLFKKPMIVDGLEGSKNLWQTFDPDRNQKALDYAAKFYSQFEPDIELLGVGSEHIVTTKPADASKVVAYEHGSNKNEERDYPLHRHEQYQMQKLFHCLFPQHFPNIYAATSGSDPHFVKERIRVNKDKEADPKNFEAVIKASRALGIVLELDFNARNFLIGKDGNIYYVDNIATTNLPEFVYKYIDENVLNEFCLKNNISEKNKQEIKKCIQRLREYRIIKSVFESYHSTDPIAIKLQKAMAAEGVDLNKTEDQAMMSRVNKFIIALDKYLSHPDEKET